jgi:hypothetical protein
MIVRIVRFRDRWGLISHHPLTPPFAMHEPMAKSKTFSDEAEFQFARFRRYQAVYDSSDSSGQWTRDLSPNPSESIDIFLLLFVMRLTREEITSLPRCLCFLHRFCAAFIASVICAHSRTSSDRMTALSCRYKFIMWLIFKSAENLCLVKSCMRLNACKHPHAMPAGLSLARKGPLPAIRAT